VISGVTAFGPLPYSLGPITSFTVNGVPAPIQAVSNQNNLQQINFQTPCETPAGGSVPVVITVSGSPATTISNVPVFAAQPGIFTYAGPNNQPYGAVISAANGTYVTPSNLAVRGQTYYVVVTGLGQTSPPLTTNQPGNTSDNVIVTAIVGVNNVGVPVISATALPDVIGGYLVAFEIPITTPASLAPVPLSVAVIVNGVPAYSNTTFLPGFD